MRLSKRVNPYPHFVDCDEAIGALIAELCNEDVDALKSEMIELLNQAKDENFQEITGDLLDHSAIRKIESMLISVRTVKELEDLISDLKTENIWNASIQKYLLPSRFLVSNVRIEKDFDCVHYTNMDFAFSENIVSDVLGRATPSRLLMTGSMIDFELQGNGYIFAYPKGRGSWLENLNFEPNFKYVIKMRVRTCIAFHHNFDSDVQCIVPLKCVENATFDLNPHYQGIQPKPAFSTQEDYLNYLRRAQSRGRTHLDAKSDDVLVNCIECGEREVRIPLSKFRGSSSGRLYASADYTCKLCDGDFDSFVRDLPSYELTVYPEDAEPYTEKVKFFKDIQNIAYQSTDSYSLEIVYTDGEIIQLCADWNPSMSNSNRTNRHFSALELYGPVFEMSVRDFDSLEYSDPRK
jgi:hypothetical protein